MNFWKGIPTVQNFGQYTRVLFNPNIDAAAELKQRMLDRTISKPHSIYAINETTKAHVLDQWVYKTIRHTLSTLGLCAMGSVYAILGKVEHLEPNCDWWYLSCVCNTKVIPYDNMYYCQTCSRRVLIVSQG
ncbi:uncharacterized protein LOC123896110 [Trifolium pratense]|uniref:uncharacterized protein LOC123896109 n=1 Tax=Trifolium pratense TaxID=57577 RepID=UPI001E691C11|nr:uncharacterized protein LOC123896109 [Trifolium pratense]XP_045802499.1 uncharacterized protein LOC123896110 [Trifolium pratense]